MATLRDSGVMLYIILKGGKNTEQRKVPQQGWALWIRIPGSWVASSCPRNPSAGTVATRDRRLLPRGLGQPLPGRYVGGRLDRSATPICARPSAAAQKTESTLSSARGRARQHVPPQGPSPLVHKGDACLHPRLRRRLQPDQPHQPRRRRHNIRLRRRRPRHHGQAPVQLPGGVSGSSEV